MKVQQLGFAMLAALALATPASAQLWVYEGFDVLGATEGDPLLGTANGATSVGVEGGWVLANGGNQDSAWRQAGLSYPGTYLGTNVPTTFGHGQNAGSDSGNSRLAIDFTASAEADINSAEQVWISFLAERVGPKASEDPDANNLVRGINNLASEYPRNFGLKIGMPSATNNNDAGQIGKGSDWNSTGETFGDPNLLVDTWGVNDFEDVDAVYTGEAFDDGTDHLVLAINTDTSYYSLWVNPAPGASPDFVWQHTDSGNQIPFVMNAIGLDAGSRSAGSGHIRPAGDWVVDEIRIGGDSLTSSGLLLVAAPEPASIAGLLGMIGLGLGVVRRR